MSRLMRPEEVAEYLAISTRQLRSLTNSGLIPYVNIGRGTEREARRYEFADVEAFVRDGKKTCSSVTEPRAGKHLLEAELPSIHDLYQQRLREKRAAKEAAKAARVASSKR